MSYIKRMQWGDYSHSGSTISLTANVWTEFETNGLGAYTNTGFTVNQLWNTSNNKFNLTKVNVGDVIHFRIDLEMIPSFTNNALDYMLSASTGFGLVKRLPEVKVVNPTNFVDGMFLYVGDVTLKTGDTKIYIRTDKDCDVNINGIFITKTRYS